MSHVVTIQTEVRDPAAIRAACDRLKLPPPVHGETEIFTGKATGYAVELPGWTYPLVCDTKTGDLHFDNYEGAWGDIGEVHRFLQAYAIEKARVEARKKGYSVTEQPLQDGSVKLHIKLEG